MDPRGEGQPDTPRQQPDARELLRRVSARAEGWEPVHGQADAPTVAYQRPPVPQADAPTVAYAQPPARADQPPAAPAAAGPATADDTADHGAADHSASGHAVSDHAASDHTAVLPVLPSPAVPGPPGTATVATPLPDAGPEPAAGAAKASIPSLLTRRPGRRPVLIGIAALAVVALLTWVALATGGSGGQAGPARTAAAGKAPALPSGYAVKAHDSLTDCAAHSRGQVKRFFEGQNCTAAQRYLATGTVAGRPVMFVVSRVQMPSDTAATGLKKVVDGDGTGNINDLLREGQSFSGAPRAMPPSGYSSVQAGARLLIAEAGFIDGKGSSSSDPALVAAAAQVAHALVATDGSAG